MKTATTAFKKSLIIAGSSAAFNTEDEIDEAIEDARDELEEKIEMKREKLRIAQRARELQMLQRFSELLDFETYDEAIAMAKTQEERGFIEDVYGVQK